MEEAIRARAKKAIEEKVFPGCVIGIVQQNGERTVLPFGYTSYESDSSNVVNNTIYDLASITKSIPAASLAAILGFDTERKVVDYLPELQNDHGATIEDLLKYRVTGPTMSDLKFKTFEEIRTVVLEKGFNGPPGESTYTNVPAFVLGMVIERVTGEILPALAHRYFFEPLEMTDTTFFPHDIDRVAPTEIIDGEEVKGIVHDESARVFAQARRAVGHAGLFSTAPDLLKFLEALLAGKYPTVVEGAQKGLGWETKREWMGAASATASASQGKRFGKTGFTGTSFLCDVERGIGLVILSNRTYPHRPPDNSAINLFRREIADIVLG